MKDGQPRFSKTKFTMLVPEVISQLEANQSIKHVVLFGIEVTIRNHDSICFLIHFHNIYVH